MQYRSTVNLAAFLLTSIFLSGQPRILQNLPPETARYMSHIPSPEMVIGHDIGARHTRTDQVIHYFEAIATVSDRVVVRRHGHTHEHRDLIHAIITSSDNQRRLEELRLQNLRLSDDPGSVSDRELEHFPAVVYLGYSIHGDEASGTEAALLALYHLAADSSAETMQQLQNTIIIIDPMLNPDGRDRFVNWVNGYRSSVPNADIQDLEHNQPWPGGRTNHYLHDLNRDWLLVRHPESRARVDLFQRWRPQLLIDAHEMGRNSTYFFQPGVPQRNNPNTPQAVFDLTRDLAEFHADYLNRIGALYVTNEPFDDFYYGKGSTYPDINGSVGILFEQASSRALVTESDFGKLTFSKTIAQQFTTTLSTLAGLNSLRDRFLRHQREFYASEPAFVRKETVKAYLLDIKSNPSRARLFLEALAHHRITAFDLKTNLTQNGRTYAPGTAVILPLDQPQGRLLKSIMETVTEFNDSIFYDVSTWTFPLAFGVQTTGITRTPDAWLGPAVDPAGITNGAVLGGKAEYAYILPWDRLYAPRALYSILDRGIIPLMAGKPFTMSVPNGSPRVFKRGSIVIPVVSRDETRRENPDSLFNFLNELAETDQLDIYSVCTGLSVAGPSLGSSDFHPLPLPKIGLLSGNGTSPYDLGEIWYLFNDMIKMPVSLIPTEKFSSLDFSKYSVVIMPNGWYSPLDSAAFNKLNSWVNQGGTLIAIEGGIRALLKAKGLDESLIKKENDTTRLPYDQIPLRRGAQEIGGLIVSVELDTTHPLAFGLNHSLPVFRKSDLFLKPSTIPGANVGLYSEKPVISGYLSTRNQNLLAGSAGIIGRRSGRGRIVLLADDPFFRSYWYGSATLLLNAVFFGPVY